MDDLTSVIKNNYYTMYRKRFIEMLSIGLVAFTTMVLLIVFTTIPGLIVLPSVIAGLCFQQAYQARKQMKTLK